MSYQSFQFLLFSAIVLLLYYLLGRKLQRWVLLAANIFFFAMAGPQYLPFIAATTLLTYFAGRWMGRIYEKADEKLAAAGTPAEKKELRNAAKKSAKRILVLCILLVVGLLVYSKYTKFLLENINRLLAVVGVQQIALFKVILPIGISFYTFMALSYILDIFWKRYKSEKSLLTYAVYLSYFPHVVQGPIDRFNEFKAQIDGGVKISYVNLTQGAQLALWGFFKKLVVADRLGMMVNTVLDQSRSFEGIHIAIAIIVYSIQIYADFSGCIDIVRGVSEMFGIKLRENFNHPYFSKTMPEFWRRWHMSLQEWFKDYIYYPVSASQSVKNVKKFFKAKNKKEWGELFASCFPILVVWLITGIWHGAAWKFVAWGLFHAALLIGSKIFEPLFKKVNGWLHIDTENFGWHFWQMLRCFLLCCFGRVFFRAGSLTIALEWVRRIFTDFQFPTILNADAALFGVTSADLNMAVLSVAILWIVDLLQEKMPLRETIAKQNLVFRWVLIFACLFAVIIFGIYGPGYEAADFIYQQF